MILHSSSPDGSSVLLAPAAGRTALMGLGCSGGRPGAQQTARRGRAGVSQAGGLDIAGARAGGWGWEGGRLNGPAPPASRVLRPRASAPRPGAQLRPCLLRPSACSLGRLRVTAPGSQSAPRAARRLRCHSFLQIPGGGAGPRSLAAGPRGGEKDWKGGALYKGSCWSVKTEEAEWRSQLCKRT